MYNLACMLCNRQELQKGAAAYLFFLCHSRHFPPETAVLVASAVENLGMMIRLHQCEGVDLLFEPLDTLRAVAKGAKCQKSTDTVVCVAAAAVCVCVNFTAGNMHMAWNAARHWVVCSESFSSELVQALCCMAVAKYSKALDVGECMPRSGDAVLDVTLGFAHEHLVTVRGNLDKLTSVQYKVLQGVTMLVGDFLGLVPDGELRFIRAEGTRPWLTDSGGDRAVFFSGLQTGRPPPPLEPGWCAVCSAMRGLRKCAQCSAVHYCSPEHQRDHWPQHRRTCARPASGGSPRPEMQDEAPRHETRGAQCDRAVPAKAAGGNTATCTHEAACACAVVVGSFVQLSGLKKAVELNGRRGRVVACAGERWSVDLGEREIKAQEGNLAVVHGLLSADPGEALAQKQEGEFWHRARYLRRCARDLYTCPNPATGCTFAEEFAELWCGWPCVRRAALLREVASTCRAARGLGRAAVPEGRVRTPDALPLVFGATLHNEDSTQPEWLLGYMSDVLAARPVAAFAQRLLLGVASFGVGEC